MGWSKVRAVFGSLLFWPTNSVVCQRASHAWHNSWRSRPEIAEETGTTGSGNLSPATSQGARPRLLLHPERHAATR